MATPTQEELDKLREENDKLRGQIADAETKRAERERDVAIQLEYTQLEAENVRLKAQLANAQELAKVGTVKSGTETLMENTKEQLAQATAVAEQPAGPVDTNAENPPKNTTGATVAVNEDDKNGGNS